MASFAEINENNVVLRVIAVHNNELLDENNVEQEAKGIAFCQGLFGGRWIQTSYNNNIRKNYAGIGYIYDVVNDAFIAPKPVCGHPELILNTNTYRWECDNEEHAYVL
jgi:hypothetical protein